MLLHYDKDAVGSWAGSLLLAPHLPAGRGKAVSWLTRLVGTQQHGGKPHCGTSLGLADHCPPCPLLAADGFPHRLALPEPLFHFCTDDPGPLLEPDYPLSAQDRNPHPATGGPLMSPQQITSFPVSRGEVGSQPRSSEKLCSMWQRCVNCLAQQNGLRPYGEALWESEGGGQSQQLGGPLPKWLNHFSWLFSLSV